MMGPLVLDVESTELTEADRRRIADPLVGMVILFTRNYENREQLKRLCDDIHSIKPGIVICVDHEGGRVQRFREGFTAIPAMSTLGERWIDEPENAMLEAMACGYVMAAELRACGVDMTFAPCLDVNFGKSAIIGERAFSNNPKVITHLALALIQGLRLAGMSNCGKHFPGHGWVTADSHLELPVDDRPFERLLFADLKPYRWMGPALDSVMAAHVLYTKIDAEPAGFSKHWLQKVLREQLHFTGVIFSDDLSMKGAAGAGSVTERAQAALAAGCDMLILCNDFEASDTLLKTLSFENTPEREARVARLAPRGTALSWEKLEKSDLYRSQKSLIRSH